MKKFDKTQVVQTTQKELDEIDEKYWRNATIEEKFETICFLRECFYGKKATTGRVQRICQMLKFE